MDIFTSKRGPKTKTEVEFNPRIPSELPILPLRGMVVYPLTVIPLNVGQERNIRLVDEAATGTTRLIGLVTSKDEKIEEPGPSDLFTVGTAAVINRLLRAPDNTVRLIVQGIERVHIEEFTTTAPYLKARVAVAVEDAEKTIRVEALMRNTIELFRRLVGLAPHLPEELLTAAINVDDPRQLVYMIATSLRMDLKDAQELLELNKVSDKLTRLDTLIAKEVELLELGIDLQRQAQVEIEKNQREYLLRKRLIEINKELGEEHKHEEEKLEKLDQDLSASKSHSRMYKKEEYEEEPKGLYPELFPSEVKSRAHAKDTSESRGESNIPSELPILPLRGMVVYPLTVIPLNVGQERNIRLVDEAATGTTRLIGLVTSKDEKIEGPGPSDLFTVGTAAVINRLQRAPDNTVRLIVQGIERVHIEEFTTSAPYLKARVAVAVEDAEKTIRVEALMRNTIELFRRLVGLAPHLPEELLTAAINVDDPRQLVYMIATSLRMDLKDAQELLELNKVSDKLKNLNGLLYKEVFARELDNRIQQQAQAEIEKAQRESVLREQAKQIKRELGEHVEKPSTAKVVEKKTTHLFLSYTRQDAERVGKFYEDLVSAGFKPWMDVIDIMPGEQWRFAIQRAIRNADFFLACLSKNSINRRGMIQKEIKEALDIWQERLVSDIYLIPVRLEECDVPDDLCVFQWVDLFKQDGTAKLVRAIEVGIERREQ